MALVAERMNRISVLIMKEDMEAIIEEIARSGVVHLTRIEEVDEWAEDLEGISVDKLSNEYTRRRRRIEDLIEEIAPEGLVRVVGEGGEIGLVDLAQIDREVSKVEHEVQPLISARRTLSEKMSELKGFLGQIEVLIPSGLPVSGLMRSTFLASAIGVIEESQLTRLRDLLTPIPSVVLPYSKDGKNLHIVAVALRRDKVRLEEGLRQVGFAKTEVPEDFSKVSSEIETRVTGQMEALEEEMEKVRGRLAVLKTRVLPVLSGLLTKVEAAILLLDIKDYCKLTTKTCLFSGWVPRDETDALVSAVKQKTGGRAIVEVTEAERLAQVKEGKVKVPALFRQPPFLKPFEMLISAYGTPSYRMVDPTLFVAITFLVMFGMMFGDVGHGLVLLAVGLVLGMKSERFKEAGKLIIYCGAASVGFGILYGSFFGLETLLPTLWVKPLENITDLFKAAIGFGIVVVSLGIILNIINSLRTHSFLENFFDKSGPLIGVVYWAGVGIAIKFMMSETKVPHPAIFYGLFVAPLVVFVLRGPVLKLMGKRSRMCPEGAGTYAMESVVEIMEILMGYLANTVSFIRVAAFGLAHAGLFVAVFSLAEVVAAKPGGIVLSSIVLILGNALIILLEGLVVTIQALRLEYYEFFGKFFKGLGSKYEPAGIVGSYPASDSLKGGE
jgi:V/A-type H+-transporting ATPase subunit I